MHADSRMPSPRESPVMPALTIAVGAMCAAALVVWLGVGFGGVSSLVKSITSAWST
jgi:hypothetical protein